jgi:hypothetical protein
MLKGKLKKGEKPDWNATRGLRSGLYVLHDMILLTVLRVTSDTCLLLHISSTDFNH